ncbi:MAG TPA: hypothetical protein VIC33_17280 [Vicinamibacterales bacterium]|jgi:D-glycero-alpha-D-manno-heptose-7-phosphate kinase
MIITRTPFRVSFAGGGTDLPAFYTREPGAVLSAAIAKYMYLTVKRRFGGTFRVSYSTTELCDQVGQLKHPIVKASLEALRIEDGLEIVSIADLPAESGLGSSSSFAVGLLNALHALRGGPVGPARLACEACEIEIARLGEPIGKQDQYIAAFGGLQFIQFQPDGAVFVDPVICPASVKRRLQDRLLLVGVGQARAARTILSRQSANTPACLDRLRALRQLAWQMRDLLTAPDADLDEFGALLDEGWQIKKSLDPSISNGHVDAIYDRARRSGALGGKLLGAGAGGFLLLYCHPDTRAGVDAALDDLPRISVELEPQGSKIIYVGDDHW